MPQTGRYAAQGAQVRAGLELFAHAAGARLVLSDDGSRPAEAAARHRELLDRCDLVLGPYGSDSVRAVARAGHRGVLWNHGGAADDVQRLPGVVSVPSPASGYLVALGRAVALLRPGATVCVAADRGALARLARRGLERAASALGLVLAGDLSLADPPEAIAATRADAVLLCGPVQREAAALAALRPLLDSGVVVGCLSAGLAAFPRLASLDPTGVLAVAQWHPALGAAPSLGPPSAEVVAAGRACGLPPLDYVAAQAYACALIAARCRELSPEDPGAAALDLRTSTFFGAFALDRETGLQTGHRLCVVRWRRGRQELLLAC